MTDAPGKPVPTSISIVLPNQPLKSKKPILKHRTQDNPTPPLSFSLCPVLHGDSSVQYLMLMILFDVDVGRTKKAVLGIVFK